MPEEINRIVTDHISDYLFAPTEISRQNLLKEGIDEAKIYVTGNTVVDAVYQNLELSKKRFSIISSMGLTPGEYFLVTVHRAENVDIKERLYAILGGLAAVGDAYSLPVILPMHPRTAKMIEKFGLSVDGITVTEPMGYLEFLQLESHAKLVLTDSGGLQEEACILGVPCITLRENTERPETVEIGANILAGSDQIKILEGVATFFNHLKWINPLGEGQSGCQIINIIKCIVCCISLNNRELGIRKKCKCFQVNIQPWWISSKKRIMRLLFHMEMLMRSNMPFLRLKTIPTCPNACGRMEGELMRQSMTGG